MFQAYYKTRGSPGREDLLNNYISVYRAHVGGRFGRSSRLVKVDFAFSLVKSEVQVAL